MYVGTPTNDSPVLAPTLGNSSTTQSHRRIAATGTVLFVQSSSRGACDPHLTTCQTGARTKCTISTSTRANPLRTSACPARPTPCPSHIDFGTALNSSRTPPFCVLIAPLSRLDRRARSCQSSSLVIANCNFASYALGLLACNICLHSSDNPLNHGYRFPWRGRNTVPQSNLRRSTCSAYGRSSNQQLGYSGFASARFPGFEYNLPCLATIAIRLGPDWGKDPTSIS